MASEGGNEEIAGLLVCHGADVNKRMKVRDNEMMTKTWTDFLSSSYPPFLYPHLLLLYSSPVPHIFFYK
jgi:hypothetical protein